MILTSCIPVMRVSDYTRARAFYRALGFEIAEEAGDPPRFGIFRNAGATLFVDAWHGADARPSPGWRTYLHCTDVDALIHGFRAVGVAVDGPQDTAYGMREAVVTDPDGNRLCFGQDAPE